MEIIAYHGTDKDFITFNTRPETTNFKLGVLGSYFTTSESVAKNFCKEKWYIKNSKIKPNSRIITATIEIFNPKFIYPLEHSRMSKWDTSELLSFRKYLESVYNHDSIIIKKAKTEQFHINFNTFALPYRCEYSADQIIVFNSNNIFIKNSKHIHTAI